MWFATLLAYCAASVSGETCSIFQLNDELLTSGLTNNYDAVFITLSQPLFNLLTQQIVLPKTIHRTPCVASPSKPRTLYFMELFTNLSEVTLPCLKPQLLPIIFFRNSSLALPALRNTKNALRDLKVSKGVLVVYDPNTLNCNLNFYTFLEPDQPQSITGLLTPSFSTNLHGYQYRIQYRRLYPYIYRLPRSNQLFGLDLQLTDTIASYQNATIHYEHDSQTDPCPVMYPTIDVNIRRTACHMISAERLFLPQWDAVCVVFPKRHERLILIQFTKPFQQEVWILVGIFLTARFFFHFDRWYLVLLFVVLTDFILAASYEVKVIEYMTTLRYAPTPRTMADLIRRRELFVVIGSEVEFLKSYGADIDMEVVNHTKKLYIGRRAALYFCKTAERFVNSVENYDPRTNDRLMVLLRERLRPYPSSYGFGKNHPLRERFERMLRWIFEVGVWRKIYDEYVREEEQFQPLMAPGEYLVEFRDLIPLWVVCGTGWLAATVVFLGELVWRKFDRSK